MSETASVQTATSEQHKSQSDNRHDKTQVAKRIATYTEQAQTIRTTCPYCGVGCGVIAQVDATGAISVAGDPKHPANFGKLCSKGSALAQTLETTRRLTQPFYQNKQISMAQQLPSAHKPYAIDTTLATTAPTSTPTDWHSVLDDVASRLHDTIEKHGRDSIMFYVSGQLLTEDYYVANKLIKGFIGNNNIDSNSRLCMSSAVAGHKRAFGADLVTGNYKDFEACEVLVLVGSNMAWCHPILFGRFLAAKKSNPNKKLIVIDPRRTDSCEFADLHLPIAAGTDTHLYNGLLHYLEQQGCADEAYITHVSGVAEALNTAATWTIDKVAEACQVPADLLRQFYALIAAHDKTVTAFSMGVNQSKDGTDKVNAIINTHLFTGRVGKVGASPFSLTGQPNAMGGREVGALANLLAAHLDLDNEDHRQLVANFWTTPQPIEAKVGIKACDAADAILDGRIKAIWIMATNPVVSLPEADKFRRALSMCDLVIVSECSVDSDTVHCADIVLPAQGWGEKSGTVTNSERYISRQRALMPAVGMAKPDWWIISQVAQRMGFAGFDYHHPSEIFNEHIALTAHKNTHAQSASDNHPRYLNIAKDLSDKGLATASDATINSLLGTDTLSIDTSSTVTLSTDPLSMDAYEAMPPLQWGGLRIALMDLMTVTQDDQMRGTQPSGSIYRNSDHIQANMMAIFPSDTASLPNLHQPHKRQPRHKCKHREHSSEDDDTNSYMAEDSSVINLRLITGRLRDQWHTMTRTGLAPQLNQHQSVPTLTLNPIDAKQLGVNDDDFVQIFPQYAQYRGADSSALLVPVMVSDRLRVGDAFMPMHWSDAFASFARVGTLIPTVVDAHSGQPELKNSGISIRPVAMKTFGKILVHPKWQDTILVQLRGMLSAFETDLSKNSSSQKALSKKQTSDEKSHKTMLMTKRINGHLPALTWSLSRQANSILIQLASPHADIASQLIAPDFWTQFTSMMPPSTLPFHSALTVSKLQAQLRFVLTQPQMQTVPDSDHASSSHVSSGTDPSGEPLMMAVYFAPTLATLPSSHWLDSCFSGTQDIPSDQRYKWLLAGRPASGYIDPGVLVCSCMSVGENIIINAITKQGCTSAVEVGARCRAGTNCGSCVSQINTLIETYA